MVRVIEASLDQNRSLRKKCCDYYEVWHFRKNYHKWKDKGKKGEVSDVKNITSEGEIYDDVESVVAMSVARLGDGWILDSACTF